MLVELVLVVLVELEVLDVLDVDVLDVDEVVDVLDVLEVLVVLVVDEVLVVELVLVVDVLVLVVGMRVVLEFRSTGQAPGGGAFFLFKRVVSLFTSLPPNDAQYRFESVPTVSTMPTCPVNGVGSVTPEPLHTALMMFAFTSTTRHGSVGEPAPVYL
jgi:hypothetical protein